MRLSLLCLVLGILIIGLACQKNIAPQNSETANADGVNRISVDDAKKEFDAGTAVFVDARDVMTFGMTHIKGAINVPFSEFETRWKEIPTDKKIIAYCS